MMHSEVVQGRRALWVFSIVRDAIGRVSPRDHPLLAVPYEYARPEETGELTCIHPIE